MIDNSALDSVVDIIRPEDFYRRDHRIIFEEIVQLLQEGHPADYLTVFESLKSKGIENDAGGLPYLTELVGSSPSAANIRRYAEIVHDKSVLRQLITVGDRIVTNALRQRAARHVKFWTKLKRKCSPSMSAMLVRSAAFSLW